MRLKYYLRGIGIGILFATILLSISFYFGKGYLLKSDLTDEEIIAKATELGMVMPEDVTDSEDNSDESIDESIDESTDDTSMDDSSDTNEVSNDGSIDPDRISMDEAVKQAENDSKTTEESVTYVPFTVNPGDSSDAVALRLQKAGLVDSATEFNTYMNKLKVDNLIQAGTFYVKQGSSYDDLVALLVNKESRTTSNPSSDE